jgi:outer membrane protein TolC
MMDEALQANKQLAITALRVKQSIADVQVSTGTQWPELKFSASHRVNQSINNLNSKTSNKVSSLAINASWELDLWNRLADESKKDSWNLIAKEQEFAAAQLSIKSQVLMKWLDIIEQNNLLVLNRKNIANQKRRLKMSILRLDNGLANSIDIRNAKTSLIRLTDSQYAIRYKHDQALRSLQVLLGEYPKAAVLEILELPRVNDVNITTLPQDILLNRPDLQASESKLIASGYAWNAAEKKKLPKLAFTFNYDVKKQQLSDLFDFDYWLNSITASLVQPILYRGVLSAQAKKSQLQQKIQLATYQSNLLNAWQEVENTMQNDHVLKNRQNLLNKALYQAQAAEQQTENQYNEGLASSFELLAAQRTRTSVETDVVKIAIARVKNRIKLTLALGLPSQSTNS